MRPYSSDYTEYSHQQQLSRSRAASMKLARNIVRNHEATIAATLTGVTGITLPPSCPLYGFKQTDPTPVKHPVGCFGLMQGRCIAPGYQRSMGAPTNYLACSAFGRTVEAMHTRLQRNPGSELEQDVTSLVQLIRAAKASE